MHVGDNAVCVDASTGSVVPTGPPIDKF
jgi:hypothetical protein